MRSLRLKIGLSYLVLVAITVAISVFAAVQFSNLSNSIGRILRENYRSVLAAENMIKALEQQQKAQLAMQVGDVAAGHAAFQASRDAFFTWYDEAIAGIALPEEPALIDSISTAYAAYLAASDSLYRLVEAGPPAAPERYRRAVVEPLASQVRAHNLRLFDVNQSAMLATRARVEAVGATATKGVIGASILAVVLSLLAVVRFAGDIVRPIGNLTNLIRRIGRGPLGQKIDVTSDDEIAELEREFNKMMERLQAYEALNVQQLIAEKKKTESLVQTIPSPVIVTDQQDRVLLLNHAAMELLDTGDRSWHDQPLGAVTRDATLLQHITAVPDGDGRIPVFDVPTAEGTRHFRRRQLPIRDADGQVELAVTLLEDVTQFRELDQLKTDFLAAVSHELRTPLTSVGMAADILLQEMTGPLTPVQRDLIETIRDDSGRLKKLVSTLLNLARLESGSYRPARETVDVGRIVEEATGPLVLPFREKGVMLDDAVPHDLPPLTGDAEHLAWVVSNLVSNALRHTPEGGTVRLDAEAHGHTIHLRVADTGTGIPPGALETIFEKFVQLKPSNETTPGSVGLGLALARRVVEAHGGRIWAESEPGRGSVFHVVLPCGEEGSASGH